MACSTLVLLVLWMMAIVVFYFIWLNFHHPYVLFGLPLFMTLTLFSLVWFNKRRAIRFEDKIIETCTRLNATENIRGISFRLTKDGMDINRPASSCYAAHYTLTIELDDRFNALKSREFREWITWPKTTYCPYDYEPVNMFQDVYEKTNYLV
ncbi:hypothetical protein G6F56_002408 [Rhizopus delemar]|nr:hypothetical protein G6F56_002408 [Rhizopus delemar]